MEDIYLHRTQNQANHKGPVCRRFQQLYVRCSQMEAVGIGVPQLRGENGIQYILPNAIVRLKLLPRVAEDTELFISQPVVHSVKHSRPVVYELNVT